MIGGDTYTYTYDAGGNLTTRTKNGETAAVYGYSSADWKDLLTSYNGVSIAYDGIGNPLNWKAGETFRWSNGRQLTGITKEGRSITYSYSESGERTSKVVDGEETAYYWLNGTLLGQKCGNSQTTFLYDEAGRAFGLIHNGAYYYYVWNQQGDVTGIIDSEGTRVVEYSYGAWGELLSVTGTMADTIGQENPLRYRGYYYDGETGFYYVTSRYYDPEIGRWINADSQLNTSLGVLGCNMFAYCINNPVNKIDLYGNKPGDLFDTMDEAARDFANYINEKSIEEDREYGSFIYEVKTTVKTYQTVTKTYKFLWWKWTVKSTKTIKTTKLQYSYKEPKKGSAHSVSIPFNWFWAKKKVAEIHTHGAYSPRYSNDSFSSADLNNWINYLVTPLGTVRKYDPSDGSDIEIFNDVPFDSNHPDRK